MAPKIYESIKNLTVVSRIDFSFEFILRKACGIEFVQKEVPGLVSVLSDTKFNLIYDTFYHLFQII